MDEHAQEGIEDHNISADDQSPLLKELQQRCERAAKYWRPKFRAMRKAREYAYGEYSSSEGDTRQTHVNIAYSTIRSLMPHIYAQDPDITIAPDDDVDGSELRPLKEFSRLLQTAVSRSLRHADLKTIAESCTMGALASGIAYAKVTYQREYGRDPHIARRIEDAQDELKRVEHLIAQVEDPERTSEHEADREKLANLMRSLDEEPDTVLAEGITIDRVMPEHLLPDPAVQQWENFAKANEIFQFIYRPRSEVEQWLGVKLEHAKSYPVDVLTDDTGTGEDDARRAIEGVGVNSQSEIDEPLVRVIECWRLTEHTVYTWVEGERTWARKPFSPRNVGERWYPFFPLAFYTVEGRFWPMSLIDMLRSLQDEYNDVRTDQAEVRTASVPTFLTGHGTADEDLEVYTAAGKYEVIRVKNASGQPLNDVIQERRPPTYNPALYDVTPIRVDIDMVSGVSDAARGAVQKTKTFGEAQILQSNLNTGSSMHRNTIEGWIEQMATYIAETLLLELDPAGAARLIGPSAMQSWPALEKRDVWAQVKLSIEAGTTGKPDLPLERESWAQALPVMQGLMEKVLMLQMQGVDPAPWVELLKRTVKIMSPQADVDLFIPRIDQGQMLAMMMQQQAAAAGGAPPGGPPDNVVPINAAGGGV